MPPWLAVGYAAVDFVGNVDFARGNVGVIWPGYTFFSLLLFVVGIALLIYAANRQHEQMGSPAFISIKRFKFARLSDRTYGGVDWSVSIKDGEVSVGNPRCPKHAEELENKPAFHVQVPKLDELFPPPVIEKADDTPSGVLASMLALDLPDPLPPTPEQIAQHKEYEQSERRRKEDKEAREELGLEPLKQSHSSGSNSGPYCFKCRELKPLPKTVGQCIYDIRTEVEAELRTEAEGFCD